MKKFVSILLCALVLFGSVAGVSYANEEDSYSDNELARERVFTYGKFINRFVKAFDENEDSVTSEIEDACEDNEELRLENKELKDQLFAMLKQAKEEGIHFEEETKAAIEEAKQSLKQAHISLTAMKEELQKDFNFEDNKGKIREAVEDESLFDDIATSILDALNNMNGNLDNTNDLLEQLIEMVENDLD